MKRRIFILFLVLCLSVSFLVIPVSAESNGQLSVDLMPSSGYTKIVDGTTQNKTYDIPHNWTENVHSIEWRWDAQSYDYTYQSIIFTIYCNGNIYPDEVRLSHYSGFTNLAQKIGGSGNYSQYRVNVQSNIAYIGIRADWEGSFTGNFSVVSCVGIRDVSYDRLNIKEVNQRAYRINRNTANVEVADVNLEPPFEIPYSKISKRSDSNYQWSYDAVDLAFDSLSFNSVASMTVMLESTYMKNVCVYLVDVIDQELKPESIIEHKEVAMHGIYAYQTQDAWPMTFVEISVDLTGYDLQNKEIHIVFEVEPLKYSGAWEYTYWGVLDCFFELPIAQQPWYQTFWNWLRQPLDLIRRTLSSIDVRLAFLNSANEQLSNAGEAMSNQASAMNDAQTQLDSVDRPDLDPNSLFGNMLTFNTGTLRVLSAVTNQPNVTAMIIVVFTFALCGYIFFGKKK